MAYIVKNSEGTDVTQAFRNKEYSGSSIYNVKLTIKEKGENKTPVNVPYSQIAKIVISSPIIDTTSNMFYVGSFISQQITITFRNLDNLPIESGNEVTLSIGTTLNGEMVYVPMGKYLIDDLSEDYQTKCEITCLDYGVKFKPAIDISKCFVNNKSTINEIFEYICNFFGVTFDEEYPKGNNITTGAYDSTISGKQWLSWIAELKGCNVKIDRDGKVKLIPLKQENAIEINALRSKKWELGEPYKITRVRYELEGIESGDTTGNTLYIRQNNLFIGGTREDMVAIVNYIYDTVKNTEIYTLKNENFGDITLDAWDNLKFSLGGDKYYVTVNDNTITFEQSIMTAINPTVPTGQQTEVVNVKEENPKDAINTIKREINTIDGTIKDTITKVNDNTSKITTIEESIDGLKIDFQKSGNNLVRNTMFYDFEGWSTLSPIFMYRGDTPPTKDQTYWYCTKTSGQYENGVVYEAIYNEDVFSHWEKTDILISNLEKTFPIPNNYNVVSTSDTKNKYISGRALNTVYNNSYSETNSIIYSDIFDLVQKEEELTLSFRITSKIKNNGFFSIDINFYNDMLDNLSFSSQPFITWSTQKDMTDNLINLKFKIPKSSNALNVYSNVAQPTDTSVKWLRLYENEIYSQLYEYNDESSSWERISYQGFLKDQNNKLYYSHYQITYSEDEPTIIATYYGLEYNGEWLDTFTSNYGSIGLFVGGTTISECNIEFGDLKLEYGNYTEWSPKRTEVIGLTHLLDETGYKIHSGDDEMRIMTDEIAQYYKDTKTFYLNKTEGYMKNAKCDTSDIDGLVTTKLVIDNKKIYGRYIR